jgi:hypothetical protein
MYAYVYAESLNIQFLTKSWNNDIKVITDYFAKLDGVLWSKNIPVWNERHYNNVNIAKREDILNMFV